MIDDNDWMHPFFLKHTKVMQVSDEKNAEMKNAKIHHPTHTFMMAVCKNTIKLVHEEFVWKSRLWKQVHQSIICNSER